MPFKHEKQGTPPKIAVSSKYADSIKVKNPTPSKIRMSIPSNGLLKKSSEIRHPLTARGTGSKPNIVKQPSTTINLTEDIRQVPRASQPTNILSPFVKKLEHTKEEVSPFKMAADHPKKLSTAARKKLVVSS